MSALFQSKAMSPGDISPDPKQPRRHFDEGAMEELALSIAEDGVYQPITVREGSNTIIFGERRWRAACMVRKGFFSKEQNREVPAQPLILMPVIVRDWSDKKVLEVQMMENLQRENMTPMEEAAGFARMRDEFSTGPREIARVLGINYTRVQRRLGLLRLPEEWQRGIETGETRLWAAELALTIPAGAASLQPGKTALEHGLEVARLSRTKDEARRALERLYTRPLKEEQAWSSEAYEDVRKAAFRKFCQRNLDSCPGEFEVLDYSESRGLFPFDVTDLLPMNNGAGYAVADGMLDPALDGLAPGREANGCWGDLALRYGAPLFVAIDGAMEIRVLVKKDLVREAAILAATGPEDCVFALAQGSGGARQKVDAARRKEEDTREADIRAAEAGRMLRQLDGRIRAHRGPTPQIFWDAAVCMLQAGAMGFDGRSNPAVALLAAFGLAAEVGDEPVFSAWPGLMADGYMDPKRPAVESLVVCSWVLYALNEWDGELNECGTWLEAWEDYA